MKAPIPARPEYMTVTLPPAEGWSVRPPIESGFDVVWELPRLTFIPYSTLIQQTITVRPSTKK